MQLEEKVGDHSSEVMVQYDASQINNTCIIFITRNTIVTMRLIVN